MRRLVENLGLKLVSLALAVLLWFAVAGEKTSEVGLTVPVELQNLPPDLEVVGETVNTVEVRLRATPAIVRRLDREVVSLRVDLGGIEEGEHFFHLTEAAVRRPFGVGVVRLNPGSLTLNLERTLAREMPIVARVSGVPADGFEVAEVVSQPATARVVGPRSRLQALASVFTEAVAIDQARDNVVASVNIGIGNPLVRIEGNPRVLVTVRVRERPERRVLSDVRLEARGGRARVRPAHAKLTILGARSALAQLRADSVRAYVEVGGATVGAARPVAVEFAPGFAGLAVESVEPAEVVVVPGISGADAPRAAGKQP